MRRIRAMQEPLTALLDFGLAAVVGAVVAARLQSALLVALGEAARPALEARQLVLHRPRDCNRKKQGRKDEGVKFRPV